MPRWQKITTVILLVLQALLNCQGCAGLCYSISVFTLIILGLFPVTSCQISSVWTLVNDAPWVSLSAYKQTGNVQQ